MSQRTGVLAVLGLAVSMVSASALGWDVPLICSPVKTIVTPYEIALEEGPSLSNLRPKGAGKAILTNRDIDDARAEFVADPFWINVDGVDYIFFEYFNLGTKQGDIGVARLTGDRIEYLGTALDEPFHLSYPQVFRFEDEYFMIPETGAAGNLRLYRADVFPTKWSLVAKLMDGKFYDPTLFQSGGKWWLFASTDLKTGRLDLFEAQSPFGPWQPHPSNPIISSDLHFSRPGGRVVRDGDKLFRVTQDDAPHYGMSLSIFEITELTPSKYAERRAYPRPILGGERTWLTEKLIHQLDTKRDASGRWVALVDRREAFWQFKVPLCF